MAHVYIGTDEEMHGLVVINEGQPGGFRSYEISDDLWQAIRHAQESLDHLHREALRQAGLLPDPDTAKETP